ncbi:C6 transcription factor [Colletotrichum plurivorum]|uniref:C6 transcription factor n=1 Tax=Colletotrichum plurivorum TaxID=2175906 RepID=A0A8H6NN54_9PEZI|nr:C6 transcription factor [Colletotrichum plurivorum]
MPDSYLRRLLPAPQASQPAGGLARSRPPPPPTKKRPTITKVACNACRTKKKAVSARLFPGPAFEAIPFSANSPASSAMARDQPVRPALSSTRHVSTSVPTKKNQSYKELVSRLASMTQEEFLKAVKELKFASDPNAALRSITPPSPQPRDYLPQLHSNVEFELMRNHPTAYPLVRKAARLRTPDSADFRPSKMARISELSDSASSSPEPGVIPSKIFKTGGSAETSFGESTPFQSPTASKFGVPIGPTLPPVFPDPRLNSLDIGFWTAVPIPNDIAANVISLYLETDHAILGLFDADLFIHDLTHYEFRYCSPLLVSALLSFACQSYAAHLPAASGWSQDLQEEANTLWRVEKQDSLTTVAALAFMVQSVGCNGDGELDVQYIKDAGDMARRLKLFGCPDVCTATELSHLSETDARATAQAAWGVFGTLSPDGDNSLTAQFYLPATTEHPPALPVPGRESSSTTPDSNVAGRLRRKRGETASATQTFAALCGLWVISSQITWFYHQTASRRISMAFALSKYNLLMAWAANLSEGMTRGEHSPAHVLVCHMFFHGTVLYLCRPFIPTEEQHGIRAWSPSAPRIPAIFAASLEQLKDLVEVYMSYPSVTNSIFWHTALMHVANAAANDTSDPEWRYYFLKCIYAYLGLYRSFAVAGVIAKGLLAMAVRKGALGTTEGYALLQEFKAIKSRKRLEAATGLFVTDLDLAVTDREAARVDRLIQKFEELTVLEEFTVGIT